MSDLKNLDAGQNELLHHLAQYHILDYPSCLRLLDMDNSGDMTAMSYRFRPLTRYGYVRKNRDGIVSVTAKGRAEVDDPEPLLSFGGGEATQRRILEVSKMGALLGHIGIGSQSYAFDKDTIKLLEENGANRPYFIPSACWRKLAPGILSTTRFLGMLMLRGKKLAMYDIGDGRMEWQVRAESSLFYIRYGSYETRADGMILVCNDDCRTEVAQNIIRQTMWSRRQLLTECYTERERPVRWSRSPIKLRAQYEHVYLTTPHRLKNDLNIIGEEKAYIQSALKDGGSTMGHRNEGDIENWPYRIFVNPATDLLKYVYFFAAAKSLLHALEDPKYHTQLKYRTYIRPEDQEIVKMYPDIFTEKKEVLVGVYRHRENAGND